MIVVDIETSGKYTIGYGVWQIGALEYENPKNYFLEEGRIDDEDEVSKEALIIIGKTEEELRDRKKQSQKQLIEHFLRWAKKCRERIVTGQNVWWDMTFLQNKCFRYGLIESFDDILGHRVIDLHSIAQLRYHDDNKKFKTKDGRSSMNLSAVLEMYGMKDERILMKNGKIAREGKPHNALEDVKLTTECLRRVLK